MNSFNKHTGLNSFILSLLIICLLLLFPLDVQAAPSNNQIDNHNCPEGMVFILGGTFNIGDNEHYPSERSAEDISVSDFCNQFKNSPEVGRKYRIYLSNKTCPF